MELEQRIEKTIASIDGIRAVEPPVDFYALAMQRVEQKRSGGGVVSLRLILRVAAVLVGIAVLNGVILWQHEKTNAQGNANSVASAEGLAKAYFSDSLYNF